MPRYVVNQSGARISDFIVLLVHCEEILKEA